MSVSLNYCEFFFLFVFSENVAISVKTLLSKSRAMMIRHVQYLSEFEIRVALILNLI